MIVRIDRSSIKKNPNAGRTSYDITGPWQLSGIIDGDIPDHLKEFLIPTVQEGINSTVIRTEFVALGNHEEAIILLNEAGIYYSLDRDLQTVQCRTPEPEYLFEYEPTLIKCNECSKESKVSEVEDYDDDGNSITVCPLCNEVDSFESIEYESITDVLKEASKREEC